jgi:hypothetical protein
MDLLLIHLLASDLPLADETVYDYPILTSIKPIAIALLLILIYSTLINN